METVLLGELLRRLPMEEGTQGINTSWRGIARTEEGDLPVIAKHLPPREIAVECVCALLGRDLRLPIPRPLIVRDVDILLFASERLPHPDLRHALTPAMTLMQALANWPKLPAACAFDEWIANADRHAGNLLTDSQGEFWLIDHGLAIPAAASPTMPICNHLLNVAMGPVRHEVSRRKLLNQLQNAVHGMAPSQVSAIGSGCPWTPEDVLSYLQDRLPQVWGLLRTSVTHHDELPGF